MGDRSMSLLLVLFYWVAIPVLVISVAAWLWRRMGSPAARNLVGIACVATLSGLLWMAIGEKWLADRQVRALCAKDGGVRVYETVRLPAEKFDEFGQIRIPAKQSAKSEDEYFYESSITYTSNGNPKMLKSHYGVHRRVDGKLLGEAISYARRGGDMPGPWHESSFRCPRNADITSLNQQIFLKN
jgi:hypothetical protein